MDQGFSGVGFSVPQVFPDGKVDISVIRDISLSAEQMGYDSLWTQERIIGPSVSLEPIALMSYLAAITNEVRIGVSVLVLPFRSPPQLAKTLATLDVLSHGRLSVGVGLGGSQADAKAYGIEAGRRVLRFNEALALIDALWKNETVDYEGKLYSLSGGSMAPKPIQKPRPPVWFGARADAALQRAARSGDGWMGPGSSSASEFKASVATLRQALEVEGRDPVHYPVSKRVYVAIDDDAGRAEHRLRDWFGHHYENAEMASRVSIWGPAQHCYEQLDALIDAGAEHLLFNPVFDYEEHLDALSRYTRP